MLIKNIMIPKKKLTTISLEDTAAKTMEIIDKHNLLSLPVVEGNEFIGVISKRYILQSYFEENGCDKEAFLQRKVKDFMKQKLDSLNKNDIVEKAVELLAEKNLQFIPVVDDNNEFVGIVTHKAVFKTTINVLGIGSTRLVVTTYDLKGRLAKLAETLAKAGANINSIAALNAEVMDLKELLIRIDVEDTTKVVDMLHDAGFTVRRIDTN